MCDKISSVLTYFEAESHRFWKGMILYVKGLHRARHTPLQPSTFCSNTAKTLDLMSNPTVSTSLLVA